MPLCLGPLFCAHILSVVRLGLFRSGGEPQAHWRRATIVSVTVTLSHSHDPHINKNTTIYGIERSAYPQGILGYILTTTISGLARRLRDDRMTQGQTVMNE